MQCKTQHLVDFVGGGHKNLTRTVLVLVLEKRDFKHADEYRYAEYEYTWIE
jgi:hypothetical protein